MATRYSGSYGGLSDLDNAKRIARRIFDLYDNDKSGAIESYEIHHMMRDAYKTINKSFEPSKADIDSYIEVLDRDNDGRVTLNDIEQLVIRFLVGDDYGKYMLKKAFKAPIVNTVVEKYLEQARRMFRKYDKDMSGRIDSYELRGMMVDTYKTMGIDYQPTQADIDSYMKMADTNNDGVITLPEYEELVKISLRKRGIKF